MKAWLKKLEKLCETDEKDKRKRKDHLRLKILSNVTKVYNDVLEIVNLSKWNYYSEDFNKYFDVFVKLFKAFCLFVNHPSIGDLPTKYPST